MSDARRALDHASLYGWLLSAIGHLCFIIACGLLLMPRGDNLRKLLTVEATFDEVGGELVLLEATEAAPDAFDEAPLMQPLDSQQELEIESPLRFLAVGAERGESIFAAARNLGNAGGQGQATFFGTVSQGTSFVYILDVSPSMNARGGRRLERAVLELLRSIDQLEESFPTGNSTSPESGANAEDVIRASESSAVRDGSFFLDEEVEAQSTPSPLRIQPASRGWRASPA